MSDSDVQVTKKIQITNDDQSAGCSKTSSTCAQRSRFETQSTDANQRVDNKAAERSRLYRERHKEKINQRRRYIRQHPQSSLQIHSVSLDTVCTLVQNTNETEQITEETLNNQLISNSRTQRQQRYYERHREEINKRKRDSRLKQNISKSMPATAAERNRNYRDRKRQEINERRRETRQRQQNVQQIHTGCIKNNMYVIEKKMISTPNDQRRWNTSNDDFIQEIAQNFTSTPQKHNTHSVESQNDRVQTTRAAFKTTEDGDFVCDQCGKSFKQRCEILRHIKTHTRPFFNKIFMCPHANCERVYTTKSNLKQHIAVKHMQIFHICMLCNARLSTKAKLTYHLRLHERNGMVIPEEAHNNTGPLIPKEESEELDDSQDNPSLDLNDLQIVEVKIEPEDILEPPSPESETEMNNENDNEMT